MYKESDKHNIYGYPVSALSMSFTVKYNSADGFHACMTFFLTQVR